MRKRLNPDQAGHDCNPPAGGFEPRPLLNMSLQKAKMPRPIDAMMRCFVRNGIKRLQSVAFRPWILPPRSPTPAMSPQNVRLPKHERIGALLVRERDHVNADGGASLGLKRRSCGFQRVDHA